MFGTNIIFKDIFIYLKSKDAEIKRDVLLLVHSLNGHNGLDSAIKSQELLLCFFSHCVGWSVHSFLSRKFMQTHSSLSPIPRRRAPLPS